MSKKTQILLGFIFLLGIAFWSYSLIKTTQNQRTHAALGLGEKPRGGDFTLKGPNGAVSLDDFKGKIVYLYFGYTFCPDICPTNLGNIQSFMAALSPEELAHFQFIFVSVDPKRDTPKHTDEYAKFFNPHMIGLTADKAQIDNVVKKYGAVYQIVPGDSPDTYSVDHSAFTYVIDPNGKLVTQLPHATSPEVFYQTFKQLEKQFKLNKRN